MKSHDKALAKSHAHKWVAQMGPGPSHACESCGAAKHMPSKLPKGWKND